MLGKVAIFLVLSLSYMPSHSLTPGKHGDIASRLSANDLAVCDKWKLASQDVMVSRQLRKFTREQAVKSVDSIIKGTIFEGLRSPSQRLVGMAYEVPVSRDVEGKRRALNEFADFQYELCLQAASEAKRSL